MVSPGITKNHNEGLAKHNHHEESYTRAPIASTTTAAHSVSPHTVHFPQSPTSTEHTSTSLHALHNRKSRQPRQILASAAGQRPRGVTSLTVPLHVSSHHHHRCHSTHVLPLSRREGRRRQRLTHIRLRNRSHPPYHRLRHSSARAVRDPIWSHLIRIRSSCGVTTNAPRSGWRVSPITA